MLDEETDSKIRRNLVLASTAILLFSWLQVPMPVIADKVNPSAAPYQLATWRLWVACLVILSYLALRYRFTPEWTQFGKSFIGTAWDKRNQHIDKLLQSSLINFHKRGKEPPYFFNTLTSIADKASEDIRSHGMHDTLPRALPALDGKINGGDQWKGTVQLSFSWVEGEKLLASSSGSSIAFAVEGAMKTWITLRSYIYTAAYSESSIRYLVPLILFVFAYITAVWQLVKALMT